MKIASVVHEGERTPGVVTDAGIVDCSDRFGTVAEAIETVTTDSIELPSGPTLDSGEVEWNPPTTPRNRIFCAAMNYPDNYADRPSEPLIFAKYYQSLVGHRQPITHHDHVTQHVDFEGELAIVIGESGFDLDPQAARDAIGGYTIINDTTARDCQWLSVGDSDYLDWFTAKGMEQTTPLGPWILTADSIDADDLGIESTLNDRPMQEGHTGDLVHGVADLVSFVSSRLRLQPGDVIATGAPGGYDAFEDVRLGAGDRMDVTIEDIGTLTNHVTE